MKPIISFFDAKTTYLKKYVKIAIKKKHAEVIKESKEEWVAFTFEEGPLETLIKVIPVSLIPKYYSSKEGDYSLFSVSKKGEIKIPKDLFYEIWNSNNDPLKLISVGMGDHIEVWKKDTFYRWMKKVLEEHYPYFKKF